MDFSSLFNANSLIWKQNMIILKQDESITMRQTHAKSEMKGKKLKCDGFL